MELDAKIIVALITFVCSIFGNIFQWLTNRKKTQLSNLKTQVDLLHGMYDLREKQLQSQAQDIHRLNNEVINLNSKLINYQNSLNSILNQVCCNLKCRVRVLPTPEQREAVLNGQNIDATSNNSNSKD